VHMSRPFDDEGLYETLKMSCTWQYVYVEDDDERYLSDSENLLQVEVCTGVCLTSLKPSVRQ
jgi:hypothetical protein